HFFTLGYFSEYLFIGVIWGIVIGFYTYLRVKYALSNTKLSKNKKITINIIIPILAFLCCLNMWSNAAILTLYLFLSSIIADAIGIIWKYLLKGKYLNFIPKYHKKGVLALIIFAIIIISGVYGMNHIELTEYNLTTDKINNESYSIVWISDIHYGTVQNPQLVKESISKINDLKPDMVVLGGDIVDERTSKEDMNEIFKELGKINSTYGTYYIFGNHDTQPYSTDYENGNRTFSDEELNKTITDNGIIILNDEKTPINNDIVLVGRSDAQWDGEKNRIDIGKILNESDLSKYVVVLDHQPIEYKENSKQGADLQISGHTHGGQVFPFSIFEGLMGNLVYGKFHFGNMELIVSSGLTGWGWSMRNEAKCEYVLININ
ncbi:MAG: metallophosphoesterase, partial [Methanobrevibacter sp.]|nr:metallophosphoesterase [Methanobrevibacter sp.]